MDAKHFNRFARLLVTASRRRLLGGLPYAALGGLVGLGGVEEAAARCPRARRCGRHCCKACFMQRDGDTGEPDFRFCCPAGAVCPNPQGRQFDLCCYADEVCRPDGTCCRTCGDVCCDVTENCTPSNAQCETIKTARLARSRA
jgi:hypothetical protein